MLEFCPHCRKTVNVKCLRQRRNIFFEGTLKKIIINNYFCEECNLFVKDEPVSDAETTFKELIKYM